ncbi:MAG: mevalonate kinase [Methanobacteriaceae archaeon]|nr:mevalonate kinase [Methanobacteriaceae archaeon]
MTQSTASAPGKTILFGEHAVVFGKPAIAAAVDRRAIVTVNSKKSNINSNITFQSRSLDLKAELDLDKGHIKLIRGQSGILNYVMETLFKKHDGSPIDIQLEMKMPVGAGLGSSAAVTVATIAALDDFHNRKIEISQIAKVAHKVELTVQGAASPLDTAVSAHGGLIFLSKNFEIVPLKSDLKDYIVIGYTSNRGNTGEMVAGVKKRRDLHPEIMDPIINSVENITLKAKDMLDVETLNTEKMEILGELMNINQGLLDAMGVNILELSKMVYIARDAGAIGSKITGAGGGGSIIALCPGKTKDVLNALKIIENAIQADFSKKGIIIH